MTTYSEMVDGAGAVRVDQVRRDDGAFVLTGLLPMGEGSYAVPNFADPDGLAYQAWLAAGGKVGAATASVADLLAYASDRQNAVLAQVWTFDVGQNGASKKVTTRLDTAGQAAMTQIALWAATSGQAAGVTIPYSNVDFSSTTLSPAEASALTLVQATALKMKTYGVLNRLAAGILATPPTVTTTAEIDAAAWPSATAA